MNAMESVRIATLAARKRTSLDSWERGMLGVAACFGGKFQVSVSHGRADAKYLTEPMDLAGVIAYLESM